MLHYPSRIPLIEFGALNIWRPSDFNDVASRFVGVSTDLLAALNKRLSRELLAVPGAWQDPCRAVAERRLPGLMNIMRRTTACVQQLEQLRALGVEIAIDDFNTAYISLSYPKQLPIDTLKIDRTCIRDVPDDGDDRAIAESVMALGGALPLEVFAEGVEINECRDG